MSLRARIQRIDGPEPANGQSEESRLVGVYRAKLLEEIDLAEMSTLAAAERRERLERVLGHIISREGPVLSGGERSHLIRRVVDEALGLGILEPLLEDASISEIMVNGPEQVFVERGGRLEQLPLRFSSTDQLMQTIERIVSTVNRRVDEANPMVDARLPTGERVNVIIPPLSLTGPVLTIRRFPRAFTLQEMIGLGSLDEHILMLLAGLVRAKFNVIVSGATGTGKTTLLNALSGLIPDGERIVTIEDSAELQLQQAHVITLESRPANVEGKGRITIRDLVRNSLRMRPDRIIVGEVRGGETLDMLQAMSTGHDGSLATVHANSAEDALMRLQTLSSMSEVELPFVAIHDQINSAVDIIVQLTRHADGSRRITEIAVVDSYGREDYRFVTVCRFDAEPPAGDGRVHGRFRYFPLPRRAAERLYMAGEAIPPAFGVGDTPLELATRVPPGLSPVPGPRAGQDPRAVEGPQAAPRTGHAPEGEPWTGPSPEGHQPR
ncbi:CpaF family protein [Streptomyces xantholiticus]|uniref:CpaF family protein n=1 Tax=Streptomyces xantholiticus TaxID=68285 RepID=UPI0019A0C75D|nr:CpaF family protein [Streptomyces xantholiticus]GGW48609.1 secretion protein [Streptomyces xantholiticus]